MAAACAVLAPAAVARDPAPGFEEFFGCPEPPAVIDHCIVSTTTSTYLRMGAVETRTTAPVVLNGGVPPGMPTPFQYNERGGMFAPWVPSPLGPGLRDVRGMAHLAGTFYSALPFGAQNPIKIELDGHAVGDDCFVGSNADPIDLQLTTGTTDPPPPNEPINGVPPEMSLDPDNPRIQVLSGGVLVDNAFRAPAATAGCDPRVNERHGLPSPAGTNTAIIGFHVRLARQAFVYPPLD